MGKREPHHTGGCQCGAVRYALFAEPFNPHVCHCRMCQKASGGAFMPFAAVNLENFAWTRGTPGIFRSSLAAERGFCRECGTPLSFRNIENAWINLTIGSFDLPDAVQPALQLGAESKISWFGKLHTLPEMITEAGFKSGDHRKFASRQHPDFEE
jgi:hypothetical protein